MPCNANPRTRRSCIQGRQPCPTPYACSGLTTTCGGESVDTSAIENPPGLFASKWFWLSGVLCGLAWTGAYLFVTWVTP